METRIATCDLVSISPYSQSKAIETARGNTPADEHEKNTWRERIHRDEKGFVIIPPMAFVNNIQRAAKYSGMKVKGQRNATYTKHFNSGVMVVEPAIIYNENGSRYLADEVPYDYLFVPSDGKPGGGSRVFKYFPRINNWTATVQYHIIDEVITKEAFSQILVIGGNLIGIGRFRPENRGYYGRFTVKDIKWS